MQTYKQYILYTQWVESRPDTVDRLRNCEFFRYAWGQFTQTEYGLQLKPMLKISNASYIDVNCLANGIQNQSKMSSPKNCEPTQI